MTIFSSTNVNRKIASEVPPPSGVLDLSTIYRDHAQFVWISLQRFGVHPADLDDIVQEVFIVVQRRLHTFDSSGRVTTWLFGICMRIAANYRRRRRWKFEILSGGRHDERPNSLVLSDELLIRREEREFADRILGKLDVSKRAIFVMFELEALSCAEIATLMNIPVGTVYSRLHSARQQLKKLLARASSVPAPIDNEHPKIPPSPGQRRGAPHLTATQSAAPSVGSLVQEDVDL